MASHPLMLTPSDLPSSWTDARIAVKTPTGDHSPTSEEVFRSILQDAQRDLASALKDMLDETGFAPTLEFRNMTSEAIFSLAKEIVNSRDIGRISPPRLYVFPCGGAAVEVVFKDPVLGRKAWVVESSGKVLIDRYLNGELVESESRQFVTSSSCSISELF